MEGEKDLIFFRVCSISPFPFRKAKSLKKPKKKQKA